MIKKVFLLLAVLLPMSAFAQKFGVVDVATVFEAMPETAAAKTQLETTSKSYEAELQKLGAAVEKLYGEFQQISNDANTPDAIKQRRMSEIQEANQKAEQFRQQAQQDLARQQQQLMEPIQKKLNDAITAVGAEGQFTFIFPKAEDLLLYTGTTVVDATDLVKAKLGIK